MEVLYEESALNQKAKRNSVFYTIANVIFWASVVIGLILCVDLVLNFPFVPDVGTFFLVLVWRLLPPALCAGTAFVAWLVTRKVNVSYDYTFVSGELRISRVFNVNKRKFMYEITSDEILQVGDVEGQNYERIVSDPNVKLLVCTPNEVPADDKFFMYLLVKAGTQKQVYVLECREELLTHILKFVKRGTLEDGYVSQETKRAEREKRLEEERLAAEKASQKADEMDEQEAFAMKALQGSQSDEEKQEEQ